MLFSALTNKSPSVFIEAVDAAFKLLIQLMVRPQASCLNYLHRCPKRPLRLFEAMTDSLSIIVQYCPRLG